MTQPAARGDQPRPDVSNYSTRVAWSAEDGEFVATCPEFPSLSWLSPTRTEAVQGLESVLAEVLADMAASGEKIPVPQSALP